MTRRVEFVAWGEPKTKGSLSSFVVTDKETGKHRAVTTQKSGSPLKIWESIVGDAATEAMGDAPVLAGPVVVYAQFSMPRAKSNKNPFPDRKRDDIDKLVRAVLDACTSRIWDDDGRVCELHSTKAYVGEQWSLPRPGVRVVVEELS